MTEALLFVSISSLLAIGAATLCVAILTLRQARRYVELAEDRLEHLQEEHARLAALVHASLRRRQETSEEHRPLVYQLAGHEVQHHHASPDPERRIEELKQELLGSRLQRRAPEPLPSEAPAPEEPRKAERRPHPANFPETAKGAAKSEPKNEGPRQAVWHPHPDDGGVQRRSSEPLRALGDASIEMFRRHYDRYLENYEGYVKLAERTCRMRETAGAVPGSPEDREWQEKMDRVNDSIKRTTTRLDILEEYNPELATDDRISRRASIAESHAKLERSLPKKP